MGSLLSPSAAVASSEQGGQAAGLAIDGDNATRWANGGAGAPSWIYVDLGGLYNVDRVSILWEFAEASDYKIQRATTVGTWTDMASYTGRPSGSDGRVDDTNSLGSFTSGTGRYIRILSSVHGSPYGLSIYEISVYGDAAPSDVDLDTDTTVLTREYGVSDIWVSPFILPVGTWTQLLPLGSYNGQDYSATQFLVSPTDPAVLFVGIGNSEVDAPLNGVFRSRNGGATWQQISGAETGGPRQVNHLTFPDPTDHDTILVADGVRGDTTGIWRTTDGGATWAQSGDFVAVSGSLSTDCYAVIVNPNVPGDVLVGYHGAWAGYNASGVLRSLDGGDTWTPISPPAGLTYSGSINIFHLHSPGGAVGHANRLLYTTEGEGFWVSDNGGSTWAKKTTEGMAHGGSAIYYAPNGDLYAAGAVVQRSTDNGETWTSVSPGGSFFYLPVAGDGVKLYTHVASSGHEVIQAPLTGPPSSGNWTDLGTHEFLGGAFSLVYDQPTSRLYGSFSGSGGEGVWAYQFLQTTLALDRGTYGVTGQSVALKHGYKMTASSGNLSLSGQSVITRAAKKVATAQGSLALTGQPVATRAARRVTAAQGSQPLTGQAVALRAARRLTFAQGTAALTGQTLALRAARRSVLAQGSLALTGQATGLIYTVARSVTMSQGSIALTGQQLATRRGFRSPLNLGTLTLTGQPVALSRGRLVTMANGGLVLTGQATGLRAGRKVTAGQGGLILTGQAVALNYGNARTLTMSQGSLALTGQALALRAARRLVLAQGALALTGQAVAVRRGVRVTLVAGSVALTGQSLAFANSRRLVASLGSLSLTGQAVTPGAGRRVQLAAGSVALTGRPVLFTVGGLTLSAQTGSYLVSGQSASLTYQAVARLTAETGYYQLLGRNVALRYSLAPVHYTTVGVTAFTPHVIPTSDFK